jgi:hypothetical protein
MSDIITYVANLNAARARVPGALDERTLCLVFLTGCCADLQRVIAMQNPQTLDAHISLAMLVADLSSSHLSGAANISETFDKPNPAPGSCKQFATTATKLATPSRSVLNCTRP